MKPENLLHAVFSSGPPPQWNDNLAAVLRAGHAKAMTLPTPLEQVQAHHQNYLHFDAALTLLTTEPGLQQMLNAGLWYYTPDAPPGAPRPEPVITREEFLALLKRHTSLVQQGCDVNKAVRNQVRQQYSERVQRQDRGDTRCGSYPFRHADLGDVHVVSGAALSSSSRSGTRYAYADVEPFLRADLSQEDRAALYQRPLRVQTLTAADLKTPEEKALIGQRGVFARTPLAAGTCLGVYGGQILDPMETFLLEDYSYIISASDEPGRLCVNGETMMSLLNTLFNFDAQGAIAGHPDTGYNVEQASFAVRLADGREMTLFAFFALTDIAPETELRICYELARIDGQEGFPSPSLQPAQEQAETV